MNDFRTLFRSNKFIFLFSFTLYLLATVIGHYVNIHIELIILPILSFLWGPYAVLGFTIIEFTYLFMYNPESFIANIIIICIMVITSITLWKSWYSTMNKHGFEIPNFGRTYNFIKFYIIFIAYFITTACLFAICTEGGLSRDLTIDYFIFTPLSIFTTLFVIQAVVYFKIPVHIPKKEYKSILPEKIYAPLFVCALALEIIFVIYIEKSQYSDILVILIVLMFLIYTTKPLKKDVVKIEDTMNANLYNKVNISILMIFMILMVVTLFAPVLLGLTEYIFSHGYEVGLYDAYLDFLIPISIPVLAYLYILERSVVNPINKVSNTLSKKISNPEEYNEFKDSLKSIKSNNEIQTLSESLLNMEDDLIKYSENLIKVTSQKERFETELKLAKDIQQSMIPQNFKDFYENKGFEIWGIMEPAREVGGDFYDYFEIDDEHIGFVIGDVSGKGITACLIMVKTMTLIQDYVKHYEDLSKACYEVNNLLCEGNVEELFVTCWLGKLNINTGKLSFVNAGHNHPLLKQNDDDFKYLSIKPGFVLGGIENISYKTHTLQLNPEDMLFLYTDGVTEANDNYKEFYGENRLQNILNKNKTEYLNNIIKDVENDLNSFCNNQDKFDDTTMFIVKKTK